MKSAIFKKAPAKSAGPSYQEELEQEKLKNQLLRQEFVAKTEKADALEMENENLRAELEALRKSMAAASAEEKTDEGGDLAAVTAAYKDMRAKFRLLRSEYVKLQKENEELRGRQSAAAADSSAELRAQITALQAKHTAASEEAQALRGRLAALEQEKSHMETTVEELTAVHEAHDSEMQKLRDEIDELNTKVMLLSRDREDLIEKIQDLTEEKSEVEKKAARTAKIKLPPPEIVEIYENQRHGFGWRPAFLPTDRPPWSDHRGKKMPSPENFELPENWEWADEWRLETPGAHPPEQWLYSKLALMSSFHPEERLGDVVRRRRWVRTRRWKGSADKAGDAAPAKS